jgi:hypothetical protein
MLSTKAFSTKFVDRKKVKFYTGADAGAAWWRRAKKVERGC